MNNKGISVLSLVITIIVMVIITSITVNVGTHAVDQSRVTLARGRLKAIADAIVANEKELGYANLVASSLDGNFAQITTSDYYIMGLNDFANTEEYPPVLVKKTESPYDPLLKSYVLKTPKLVRKTGIYKDDEYVEYDFNFYEKKVEENFKVEFDDNKGVNRPLFSKKLIPVKTYFNEDTNDPSFSIVKDIYTDDWYNYSKESPMWANAVVENSSNVLYVWIPRFAYSIQSFYISKDYLDVPGSAISVLFLRGTSDYTANGETLPAGYQVHPAFKYKDSSGNKVELPGFWVAKRNTEFADCIAEGSGVVAKETSDLSAYSMGFNTSEVSSHLLKNTEWAAIVYLSMATVGVSTNGNSLINSASGVLELDERCFVAGGLASVVSSNINYADKYYILDSKNSVLSYDSYEGYSGDNYGNGLGRKFGDAIIATSSGLSDTSAWLGGTSVRLTEDKPYIVRGIGSNMFAYDAESNIPDKGGKFRSVLIVRPK